MVFIIAMITYMLTREARGSLWDCGEFVSTAYKLQMPHPPGAPVFTLLGRLFIIIFGDNPITAANAVNFMSAAASAGTILFLFWTITHFARKMFVNVGENLSANEMFAVMAAGVVGALAYTFSDSFWYSAVEGEVYALSSFFTALVFWAMLKWEHADEHAGADEHARARADRWIIFLSFMIGLAIGVHLLVILCLPAIVMIYYYRRYKPTPKGALIAFLIGCLITGIVQLAIIQYSMKAAGLFDIFFVNTLGMPFFTGFAFYFVLVAGLIVWALKFNEANISKTKLIVWTSLIFMLALLPFAFSSTLAFLKIILLLGAGALLGYFIKPSALKVLKLFLWCYAFMMLGYFMYFTSLIRSNANPSIDMNNVDNPINLVYYLGREQYGSAPLVYGPHFSAQPEFNEKGDPYIYGEMQYVKGDKKYIPIGRNREVRYQSSDKQLFPRIWDASNDQGHAQFYADWLGIGQHRDPNTGQTSYDAPNFANNLNWFFSYQTSWMYLRYFMWNFAGRQNDLQGFGNKRDGNWISGIPFMDTPRLGDQSKMPDSIKHNKANNSFYLLPFLLGIIGMVYQYLINRKDFIVTGLLFFFTGMAIVLYLNQPGNQPRERDYAYVGSFYAFAVWIGLAVIGFVRMAREKFDKNNTLQQVLYIGGAATFVITALSSMSSNFNGLLIASIVATALFVIVTLGITYLARALSAKGTNFRMANIVTSVVCLLVPILMAQQVWDDHDRSQKTLAPDLAKDYLESCAPNAILFTFGDNDTYPLWYAQEVEGVRTDIRIINTSLLGIDWYINQLRRKVNNADAVDVIWTPEQIEGHNREYIRFVQPQPGQGIDPEKSISLYEVMKNFLGVRVEDVESGRDVGPQGLPFKKFFVPVDKAAVLANGTANANDSLQDAMHFEIPANMGAIQRNDLMILNIIASNQWKRPIYFTAPYGELGFGANIRKDGLSYRLVPFTVNAPQQNWVTDQAMRQVGAGGTSIRDNNENVIAKNLSKFEFGGANKKGTYFDEENRRHLLNIRSIFAEAAGNLADGGKKDEAAKLLEKAEAGILPENLPYAMVSRYSQHNQTGLLYIEAFYKTGKLDQARKVAAALRKDVTDQRNYYNYLRADKPEYFEGLSGAETQLNDIIGEVLNAIEEKYDPLKQKTTSPVHEIAPGQQQIAADSAAKQGDRKK